MLLQTQCRLSAFLEDRGARFETLRHRQDYTAQEAAADTHTPGREFAKVVIVRINDGYAMLVLPAHRQVDLLKLRTRLGGAEVALAAEDEMRNLFPDCDVGAEPPFGNLYGLPTYLAVALEDDEWITFNAGSHDEVIRMRFREFERLVHARLIDLSKGP
jgi:Ala-tRNA(Pro) deacylase